MKVLPVEKMEIVEKVQTIGLIDPSIFVQKKSVLF